MGCGSSTLKGEQVDNVGSAAPAPMKKVRTNFSDVNFSGNNNDNDKRRPTLAVAPDEQQRRPTKISETVETDAVASTRAYNLGTSDGILADKLQQGDESRNSAPYRDTTDENGLASPAQEIPQIKLAASDPTTAAAKSATAAAYDPANDQSRSTSTTEDLKSSSGNQQRRKSWLDRLKDINRDKSMEISDEELKKQTGMTRAEFEEWKKNPNNRVAGRQDAGAPSGLTGSAMAM